MKNKRVHAQTVINECSGQKQDHCFRLQNKRFHPGSDEAFIRNYFQMDDIDVEASSPTDDEVAIRNYFQMDAVDVKKIDAEDSATDRGIDSDSECAEDDDALDVLLPSSSTTHDLWKAWHNSHASRSKTGCDEEWDDIFLVLRRAAYLRGLRSPAFIPTWRRAASPAFVPTCDADAPDADAPSADLSVVHLCSLPETHSQADHKIEIADDVEEWEAYADMSDEDLWNALANKAQHGTGQDSKDVIEASQSCVGVLRAAPALPAVPQMCKPESPQKPKTRVVNTSSRPAVVEKQPTADVSQYRFQGKIKARELNKTKRSMKMNYGFIEVNPRDLKALHEHPLWTSDLEIDVFWHSKDCDYDAQYAGDIVTFSVILKPQGGCLQAQKVELKKRAEWWHAVSL